METHNTERPKGISYEMIWAADLKVPSMLYLLLDDQPAMTIPITSSETMAIKKKTPDEMVDPDHDDDNGNTAKPQKTATKIKIGAALKSHALALPGTISSF